MSRFVKTRIQLCRCGGLPSIKGDQRMHLCWVECSRCGFRTEFYGTRRKAIDAWNRMEGENK